MKNIIMPGRFCQTEKGSRWLCDKSREADRPPKQVKQVNDE